MITFIWAVIIFAMLILFHEAGHFTVAKFANVKVHEFAIGMGPRIFKFGKGETTYSLRALPIGGYVKMEGEDERSEDERAFGNRPVWARIAVVAAGAFMNFILGYLLFILILSLSSGIPEPVIDELVPNMPAEQAGLLPGDRIVRLNNKKINIQSDIQFFLMVNGGNTIDATVLRNGEKLNFRITPVFDEEYQRYMLGYVYKIADKTVFNILRNAYYESAFIAKTVFWSLGQLLTGKASFQEISGPVGIVREIGNAAQAGIVNLLYLSALISINLGIFNLLPIPALDGGRIVFLVIESIRRKPIDPEKEGLIHFIGFALLILLMIAVTFKDVFFGM